MTLIAKIGLIATHLLVFTLVAYADQDIGEPNCLKVGGVTHACNCTSPAPVVRTFAYTFGPKYWKHTGVCAGEKLPCPWTTGGKEHLTLSATLPPGKCYEKITWYWCCVPAGTIAICTNGVCPDGPEVEYNVLMHIKEAEYDCP